MRIRELNLIRYGKFTDHCVELPRSDKDFHVIVGPNEAGKSTILSAITDWLFGIPPRTSMDFIHQMPELRIGGSIEKIAGEKISGNGTSLAFDRRKGNKNTLHTQQGELLSDDILQQWLGGFDRQAFTRIYAINHSILVTGGESILSASDDLGQMLFQSASGMQQVELLLRQLNEEKEKFWGPRKASTREYYQALEAFDSARKDVKEHGLRSKDWESQREELVECEQKLDEKRKNHSEILSQISRLERIRRVQPWLLSLDDNEKQLNEMLATGHIPLLPENASAILDEARREMILAEDGIARSEKAIADAVTDLEKIHIDHQFLSLASDIANLNQNRLKYSAHHNDIIKRKEELRQKQQHAIRMASDIGWSCATGKDVAERLPGKNVRLLLVDLLRKKDSLFNRLQTAQSGLLKRQQDIAAHEETIKKLAPDEISQDLRLAVAQAPKPDDHVRTIEEFDDRLRQIAIGLETASAGLGKWQFSPDLLARMSVPDSAIIQSLINEQRDGKAKEKNLESDIEAKKEEYERTRKELEHFIQTLQPISREQVIEARTDRNNLWNRIRKNPPGLNGLAHEYEIQVARADNLADSRLNKMQHEAEHQSRLQTLERLQQDLSSLERKLDVIRLQAKDRNIEWKLLADKCGLPDMPLEIVPNWLEQRLRVIQLSDALTITREKKLRKSQAAENARMTLWKHLNPHDQYEKIPELLECLNMAGKKITLADQAHGQRNTLEKQISEGNASLIALQNDINSAENEWNEWKKSWQHTIKLAGYADDIPTDRVESDLAVMDEINNLLLEIDNIQKNRIDTMQADLDHLEKMAQNLGKKLVPDLGSLPVDEIIATLVTRLDTARQASTASDECKSRIAKATQKLNESNQTKIQIQARLSPLFNEADVNDMSELALVIDKSEQRRKLEQNIAREKESLKNGSDGLSIDQLRAEISDMGNAATLVDELEQLRQRSDYSMRDISSLSGQHGIMQDKFGSLSGKDTAVVKAESRRHEALASMTEAVERYLQTHVTARLLEWSIEKFRDKKQGPMLAKASEIFRALTLGSFTRLSVDMDDQNLGLSGVRPDSRHVDVRGMSEGSRDQLYLALRLASLEMQAEKGFSMPLIADDLFINFDDDRTMAGLDILGKLSRNMQVIFLTHHDHLIPLARKTLGDGVNIVTL